METTDDLDAATEPPGSRSAASSTHSPTPCSFALFPAGSVWVSSGALSHGAARPHAFPCGERTALFRARHYPDTDERTWSDWRWQLRHTLRTEEELARVFTLSDAERGAIVRHGGDALPVGITPYYASLMRADDPSDPVRRTHIPTTDEYVHGPRESLDPLAEDKHTVVPGLVHRYPDRVLLLATDRCSTYCRYCTRARMVGQSGAHEVGPGQWQPALHYIETHPEIRDVLISGGDALVLSDPVLDDLLGRVRRIPHVEFVRLGTKVPAVLPMRVTPSLLSVLRKHAPIWMSLHFTHPAELTPESLLACNRLADAGVPLGSQTVLLRGINDDVDTMRRLFHGLLRARVRPYYIYQCDPVVGTAQFRTPISKGLEIIRGLRGFTSGYAVPNYVIDAPGGGGKIPLMPDFVVGREGDDLLLRNFEGRVFRYPDSDGSVGSSYPGDCGLP